MEYFNAFWNDIPLEQVVDPLLRRQINALKKLGVAAVPVEDQVNVCTTGVFYI